MAEYRLTSTNQMLDEFMKREFKDNWKEILSDQLRKLKIDNIANADDEIKRVFLKNVLTILDVSAQKKEIYNSELKKILDIKTKTQKTKYDKEEKKNKTLLDRPYEEIQRELFNVVRKEIDGGYYKVESIFNLFWLKAIEAELKGMSHDKVMKIVGESLNVVKNDVNVVFLKFEDEAELNKEFFKILTKINKYVAVNAPTSPRNEKKKKVANLIYNTKKDFDSNYQDFVNYFLNTINEQIKFKKTGRSDFYLVNSDKKTALNTWNRIKGAYKGMSDNFKKKHAV